MNCKWSAQTLGSPKAEPYLRNVEVECFRVCLWRKSDQNCRTDFVGIHHTPLWWCLLLIQFLSIRFCWCQQPCSFSLLISSPDSLNGLALKTDCWKIEQDACFVAAGLWYLDNMRSSMLLIFLFECIHISSLIRSGICTIQLILCNKLKQYVYIDIFVHWLQHLWDYWLPAVDVQL